MKQNFGVWVGLIFTCLMAASLQAATFSLPGGAGSGPFANCTANGGTVSCSGSVSIANNDEVQLSQDVVLNIAGDLSIGNSTVINPDNVFTLNISIGGDFSARNTLEFNANLEAGGDIDIGNNAVIEGNLTADGDITLGNGSTVSGRCTASGGNFADFCDAPLLAIDDFESYSSGSINNLDGGIGWGGAWSGVDDRQNIVDVSADPLLYVAANGERIVGGNRALVLSGNNNRSAERDLPDSYESSPIYVSMLIRTRDFNYNANNRFAALWFNDSAFDHFPNLGIKTNQGNGSGPNDFFVRTRANAEAYSTIGNNDEAYFLVARLSRSGGGSGPYDRYELWVNPNTLTDKPAFDVFAEGQTINTTLDLLGFRTVNLENNSRFEIDRLAVGTQWSDVVSPETPTTDTINHFELDRDMASGLTCMAMGVTLRACANDDCTLQFDDTFDVTLNPTQDWVGGNTRTGATSPRSLIFAPSVAQDYTFGISSSDPTPKGNPPTRCLLNGAVQPDCVVTFVDAALLLTDGNGDRIDLDTQVAGVDFNPGDLYLSAVETDTETGACQAAIEGDDQVVRWAAVTENPTTPNGYDVRLNNVDVVTQASNATPLGFTDVSQAFDSDGRTATPFTLHYGDVGRIRLEAETDLMVEGATRTLDLINGGPLIVRPQSLRIAEVSCNIETVGDCFPTSSDTGTTHQNPGTETSTGAPFVYAGAPFQIIVQALNAQGVVTPNFGNEVNSNDLELAIDHNLGPHPATTYSDGLALTVSNITRGDGEVTITATWPETGSVNVLAQLENYLSWPGSLSTNETTVGRFIPFEYGVEWLSARLQPPGPQTNYVYQSQAFNWMVVPAVELTPHAFRTDSGTPLSGTPTRFFEFETFTPAEPEDYSLVRPPGAMAGGELNFAAETNLLLDGDENWLRKMEFADTELSITKVLTAPDADQVPELITLDINYTPTAFTDADGVCRRDATGDCLGLEETIGSSVDLVNLVYGRLVLKSTQGPENRALPMPMQIQRWTSEEEFVRSETPYDDALDLSGDQFTVSGLHGFSSDLNTIVPQAFSDNGDSTLSLATPDGPGEIGRAQVLGENVPVFLRFPWPYGTPDPSSPDELAGPRAIASFGTYEGRPPLLFVLPQGR